VNNVKHIVYNVPRGYIIKAALPVLRVLRRLKMWHKKASTMCWPFVLLINAET